MSPRLQDDDDDADPVTAEYDIYLTPHQHHQIYLLQYPNRARDKPYNTRTGVAPKGMRIKPQSGYLELDLGLNTANNFDKYKGLRWGGKDQGESGAGEDGYGIAAGFSAGSRRDGVSRRLAAGSAKDEVDRALAITNDLQTFYDAQREGRVMRTQTLGGRIAQGESVEEAGKPLYFVGAFRGRELHLSQVDGTVQMRPQFHHLDAEEHRNRHTHTYSSAAGAGGGGGGAPPSDPVDPLAPATLKKEEKPRILHQTYKPSTSTAGFSNPKGELEEQSSALRSALQTAAEEKWISLPYVDEDDPRAYEVWEERMLVRDVGACAGLKSAWDGEGYLDAVAAVGRGKRRGEGKGG